MKLAIETYASLSGYSFRHIVSECLNGMEQYQKDHLERVSVENFEEWELYSNPFISYASSTGKHGTLEIGISSDGMPAIRKQGIIHKMGSIAQAISEYHRLFKINNAQ